MSNHAPVPQIKASLANTAMRALGRAVDVHTMTGLARRLLDRRYDLHDRTGFQRSIPIPSLDAARQIVEDIRKAGLFLDLVNLLIEIQDEGLMGRRYSVPHLRELVRGIHELGFDYDHENRMFVEDPHVRMTRNWGVLREGQRYVITFLRLDVVGNSTLVRKHQRAHIEKVYTDLAGLVHASAVRRNGRLWSWEGDGGLAAFYFSNKNSVAALAAIEVVHELFLYNRLVRRIGEDLRVRMAVHAGPTDYTHNMEEIKKSDTIKRVIEIESRFAKPNTVAVSNTVYSTLEPRVAQQLRPVRDSGGCYAYELRWER